MKKAVVCAALLVFFLYLSPSWADVGPLLYDIRTGEVYAPLNEPEPPQQQRLPEDVQPPIHQRDYREEFVQYKQEQNKDWPERDPRLDERYRVEIYPRRHHDKPPELWRHRPGRQPPRIRTLLDGSFEKYNPDTGLYESVPGPNDPLKKTPSDSN